MTALTDNLARYSTAVVLTDGSALRLRAITCDDQDRLLDFFNRLSRHTVYLRFHHLLARLSREEAHRLCNVDYVNSFALVGTIGEGEQEKIIAVGRYYRLPRPDRAEVAFTVKDTYQGKGIGTHLLEQLADIARRNGIRTLEADVLGENDEMLKVFRDSGYLVSEVMQDGVYRSIMNIAPAPEAAGERSFERERLATIASLRAFLKPRSIAVIGASNKGNTIGNHLFKNLLRDSFQGVVYPVNPTASYVAAVSAYPSVLDIPGEVDLAIVIVNAAVVPKVVEECGRKGVKGAVIVSAGFAETGKEGEKSQERLVEIARSYGMRLVGPNCMGLINTDPAVSMNATFSPVYPLPGNIAFCTQSGALGLAILEYARTMNFGLSTFASIGNRADVSSNDFLQYWEDDPATRVILLYVESFGNPRKFARIARNVSLSKPVVAVKSGRTPAGSRAAASHTGALAGADVASEALFAQAGIIRVDTLDELFDVATLLINQPVPRGRRVAVLTNGGGPGIMTADACAQRGLELPGLTEETIAGLRKITSTRASLANPVDITAEGTAEQYNQALRLLAQDENIDIGIVIFIPPVLVQRDEVAAAIRDAAPEFRRRGKTLVASFMGLRGSSIELGTGDECCVPSYTFPEDTASSIARACEYGEWLKKPKGRIPEIEGLDRPRARETVKRALESSQSRPLWLDAVSLGAVFEAYGIKIAPLKLARSAAEAAAAVEEIGFPAAVKLVSDTIVHKTEVGGVVLDVRSPTEAEAAFKRIQDRLKRLGRAGEMQGVAVQQMVSKGIEIIIGVTQDPSFGPLIMFGLGGTYAELFRDVVFRIHPLTDADAREMVRSVKAYRLLEGWRGARPSDIGALEDLLLRVSALVEDIPEIKELDLNPVKALERGYAIVDARMLVG